MENETATTNRRRMSGAELSRRISLIISGILVTLLIVFMILNFQRWVTIDFLIDDVRTRVIWALLAPFAVGLVIGWLTGISKFAGVMGPVPDLAPTLFRLDLAGVLNAGMIGAVFALLFVDFFDTAGTLTSVVNVAGKVGPDGRIEGVGRAVISDAAATVVGALLGTSNTTSYIESGAGIKEGGRTGLTAVTVAVLFLLCLGFAPLARSVPSFAAAAALVFVATYFTRNLAQIDWDDATEYAPAVLGALLMPLTYSIANGIAVSFIVYAVAKLATGRWRELNPGVALVAVLGVLHYAFT